MFKSIWSKLFSKKESFTETVSSPESDDNYIEIDIDKDSLELIDQARGELSVEEFIEKALENWCDSEEARQFDEEALLDKATLFVLSCLSKTNFPITYQVKKGSFINSSYITSYIENEYKSLTVKVWPIFKKDRTYYSMTITKKDSTRSFNSGYSGSLEDFKNPIQTAIEWFNNV